MSEKIAGTFPGTSDTIKVLREMLKPEQHSRFLLVGGAVRDFICALPVDDVDLICDLPEKILLEQGFRRVEGKTTAPILFKSDPVLGKVEITIIGTPDEIEKDLTRRDFRCNAVAMTLDGTLIDPLGGVQEIMDRILSPCCDSSLPDDPVRIFRAFRFASNGWRIAPELGNAIRSAQWDDLLANIPVERFTREMLKAMAGTCPGLFFQSMLEYGVGKCYLPELFRMRQIPAGPAAYHGNDTVFSHSLAALQRMAAMTPDSMARLAAFFHDIGKLSTPAELLPRHLGHDKAGTEAARFLATRLRLSAIQRNALIAASSLHMTGGLWSKLRDTTRLRLASQSLKTGIADFFPQLVAADRGTSPGLDGWDEAILAVSLSAADLGIDISALEKMPEQKRTSIITQSRLIKFRQLMADYKHAESTACPGNRKP